VAVIGGEERQIHFFCLDLPHSDACFVKAYPAETAEAFCDGHDAAFAFFGGVPRSMLYDNTRLAVARILGDGTRQRTRAFAELQSHFLFADRFGRPGKGNDKGKVEGLVGYARRNFLVPVPRVESLAALNAISRPAAGSAKAPACAATTRPSASGWRGTGRRCCLCPPPPTRPAKRAAPG
jgi:transposase